MVRGKAGAWAGPPPAGRGDDGRCTLNTVSDARTIRTLALRPVPCTIFCLSGRHHDGVSSMSAGGSLSLFVRVCACVCVRACMRAYVCACVRVCV